jgi:hypothetical protein
VTAHTYDDALFRAQFPAFASTTTYPEALLSGYWSQASCYVSAHDYGRLIGDCRQLALNQLTAHLAILGAELTADPAGGTGIVSASSIDKVSVTLQIPASRGPFVAWLNKTGFGQQLAALLRVKSTGGTYVGGFPERAAFRKAYGAF